MPSNIEIERAYIVDDIDGTMSRIRSSGFKVVEFPTVQVNDYYGHPFIERMIERKIYLRHRKVGIETEVAVCDGELSISHPVIDPRGVEIRPQFSLPSRINVHTALFMLESLGFEKVLVMKKVRSVYAKDVSGWENGVPVERVHVELDTDISIARVGRPFETRIEDTIQICIEVENYRGNLDMLPTFNAVAVELGVNQSKMVEKNYFERYAEKARGHDEG